MIGDLAVGLIPGHELAATLECPHCGGELAQQGFRCKREGCGTPFRSLLGIPDLRIAQQAAVAYEQDWRLACSLADAYSGASFQDLVEALWQGRLSQETVSREHAEMRIGQIKRARLKHAQDLADTGWLGKLVRKDSGARVLDLGCGPGGFLLAADRRFGSAAGIDISMAWLVVCRKHLESEGISALLVCACAERIPFKRDTFDLVMAFDALEHVADRDRMVHEAHRVARPDGIVVCTTPNRFSLSGEPHHKIWGVGLLPRAWMPVYVRWRTGQDYRFTFLLSIFDIRRLFARHFSDGCRIVVPELWGEDIQHFSPVKRFAARIYNAVIRLRLGRGALTLVAPFFRVVARKEAAGH